MRYATYSPYGVDNCNIMLSVISDFILMVYVSKFSFSLSVDSIHFRVKCVDDGPTCVVKWTWCAVKKLLTHSLITIGPTARQLLAAAVAR